MPKPLAYFIMAHQNPRQLRGLVEALTAAPGGARDLILLHVDLKSRLGLKESRRGVWPMARALAGTYPNVHVMRPRFTNWGGWSLAAVQLAAIRLALKLGDDWGHFINLSGQCYPIKPLPDIRAALAQDPRAVYVQMRPFDELPADDWHLRWHPMVELPHKALKFAGPRQPPSDFTLDTKGSQWSMLPRGFCAWQQTAPIAAPIKRYLRHLLLSDELIMQTLVRNGPWLAHVAPHYGREIVWPGPKVMTLGDWPRLLASPAFFARKFDERADPRILPALAREFGFPDPCAAA